MHSPLCVNSLSTSFFVAENEICQSIKRVAAAALENAAAATRLIENSVRRG
jgi:hypothetical protein